MGFFSSLFGSSNTIKRQPSRNRINIVAVYEDIVEGEFYSMILDFQIDSPLIDRIKSKEISRREIKEIFIIKGEKINDSISDHMQKLASNLNEGDLCLTIDLDTENSYEVDYDFFFN